MHRDIEPAILYFGTPVVLVSTINEDGSANLAPISSIWWLGWSCMIGMDATSQSVENIKRTGECVLNMPSADLVESVNKLAKTTGRTRLPLHKKALGYRYVDDKFELANLTMQRSKKVSPPRVLECPVQLEATLSKATSFAENNPKMSIPSLAFELNIEKVHVLESLLLDGKGDHVDPDKWHPLIMSFRKFYTTGDYVYHSKLNEGAEDKYAPWKQKGLKRKLTQWALARDARKFK